MSDTTGEIGVILPYKGVVTGDIGLVYTPYVPVNMRSVSYWYAAQLYEDTIPLVVIDGQYPLRFSSNVRDFVERWIADNAKGAFYWDDPKYHDCAKEHLPQADLLRFTDMEDAILFKLAFSGHQLIA